MTKQKTRTTKLGTGYGRARVYSGGGDVGIDLGDKYNYAGMEPGQARKLAALLIEAADKVDAHRLDAASD